MRIKSLRVKQNISQKELALSLKISQSALCMYEKGDRNPSIELLPRIASALNCTIDELLREEVPEEKNESNSQTFANLEN